MEIEDLLERMAATLRHDIGPDVAEPYARTQAFMASVILDRVARQLRSAGEHARADQADQEALVEDLEELLGAGERAPAPLREALAAAREGSGSTTLSAVVTALYGARCELGDSFDVLMARVRRTLRARLDRQLEVAS